MIKSIILVFSVALGVFSCFNLIELAQEIVKEIYFFQYFFFGGTLFSIFIVIKYQESLIFYSTFEHELTHNLWALFFLKKPKGFHVNKDGSGLFEWEGDNKFSGVFILLAPYFFPTACFLWLPFHVMCKEEYYWFYFLMMGVFFGYHLISTLQETGTHQSDITNNGILYSYIVLFSLNVFFSGIIIAHLVNGFQGIVDFSLFDSLRLIMFWMSG